MMKTFVLLVLSLGLYHFAFGNHLRIFEISHNEKNWSTSFNICRQINTSLVTAYDEQDIEVFQNLYNSDGMVWLGLHKQIHNTTWSNGEPLTFNISQVTLSDETQICEAMANGTWEGFNCSDRKPFMCYKDNNYMLIEEEKNWCQALQFCRRHYTNLVSISNETQNKEVFEKGKNRTFWIGLRHDQWTWADNSCSTFRKWNNPSRLDHCTKTSRASLYLFSSGCAQHSTTLCSKGNVRIKVVEKKLTWEKALDYCKANHTGLLWIEDADDQSAVEQWLNDTNVKGPFWIGLKQSSLFGFWIWSDRTVGYSNWKTGKPPKMPMSNQCGAINNINTRWMWSDENCWHELYFLCEEEIVFM